MSRTQPASLSFALGFSALHTLYVNMRLLLPPLRPGWPLRLGLVACAVFYIGISSITFVQQWPKHHAAGDGQHQRIRRQPQRHQAPQHVGQQHPVVDVFDLVAFQVMEAANACPDDVGPAPANRVEVGDLRRRQDQEAAQQGQERKDAPVLVGDGPPSAGRDRPIASTGRRRRRAPGAARPSPIRENGLWVRPACKGLVLNWFEELKQKARDTL